METYHNFSKSYEAKKFYLKMEERAGGAFFPKVTTMGLNSKSKEVSAFNSFSPFNGESIERIKKSLEKGEQVLVFINRLGYAKFIQCSQCGKQFECPNCSVNFKAF